MRMCREMKKQSCNLKSFDLRKFKAVVLKIAQCCIHLWDKYIFGGMYFDPILPYASSQGQWIYFSILLKNNRYKEERKDGNKLSSLPCV